jgi:hypothetical protein
MNLVSSYQLFKNFKCFFTFQDLIIDHLGPLNLNYYINIYN